MTTSRRRLLIGLAGLAGLAWSWQRFGVEKVNLTFEPIPELPGWQRGQAGALSTPSGNATSAVFAGIGDETVDPLPAADLCQILYKSEQAGLPIAVFTDAFCPNCQIMDPMLAARNDLAITWHQLPLLGPASEQLARATLAAELQGEASGFRDALLKQGLSRRPNAHLRAAEASGIDVTRLLSDMEGDKVVERLDQSQAAAETLGVWGTPAITIGQTLVLGRLSSDELDAVIAMQYQSCASREELNQ